MREKWSGLGNSVVMRHWDRPWNEGPPEGRWRLFMVSCESRPNITENTTEAMIDLLRGCVDTGLLQPDDVVRDIVLVNGQWAVRGWRHA